MKYARIIGNLLGLLMILFISTTCKSQEENLSFETIAQGNGFYTSQGYGEEEPNLIAIAGPDEVDQSGAEIQFPLELATQLRQLDYDHFFAILVLQGLKGQGGYSVTVQRVTRQDDQINVEVKFAEPALGTRRIQAFTSPYHLIAVSKQGEWGQQVNFALRSDSEKVAETAHFIP